MEKQIIPFELACFNNLPSIETANEAIQIANKLELAVSVLGPIFLKHKMYNSWGISLLHKHFSLEKNEMAIQDVECTENRKSYITIPRTNLFEKQFYPAVFKIKKNGKLLPLEFSTDTSALMANNDLKNNPNFVEDFYKTLVNNDLDNTFGLIYGKEFNSAYELVEFNFEERISILNETLYDDAKEMKLIQTSWFFSPNLNNGKCKTKCMSSCSVSGENHSSSHSTYHDPNG
jgi:hypothetical protein